MHWERTKQDIRYCTEKGKTKVCVTALRKKRQKSKAYVGEWNRQEDIRYDVKGEVTQTMCLRLKKDNCLNKHHRTEHDALRILLHWRRNVRQVLQAW